MMRSIPQFGIIDSAADSRDKRSRQMRQDIKLRAAWRDDPGHVWSDLE